MTSPDEAAEARYLRTALLFVAAITLVRVAVLFLSPLELYPDEAQYWVWSRRPAWGYFSKPPMIAWLVHATTLLGGNGEAWVRFSAPFLHAAAALALFPAGKRLYDARAGWWACVLYTLAPGVVLSSAVITTDAPLMLFVALGVWAYAALWTEPEAPARRRAAAALGLTAGLAFLAKYAALYLAGGVMLHAAISQEARRRWNTGAILAAVGVGLIVAAPNILWNAANHFQTVTHTAENADIGAADRGLRGLLGERGPFAFILGQFGVFGPLSFAVLLVGTIEVLRRRGAAADRLLLCLAVPAFVIVFAESIVSRANANWAAAAYAPGALLVAGLLARWRARRWFGATVTMNGLIFAGLLACVLTPGLADAVGVGNAFKRARGWRADAGAVVAAARSANARTPLTAVAVDDRFLFNALSYYARDGAGRPAGALPAPLTAWVHLARPANQAEAEAPLTPANGRHVLAISAIPRYRAAFLADFRGASVADPPRVTVRLDPRHARTVDLFMGNSLTPRPRDPVSGLPIAP